MPLTWAVTVSLCPLHQPLQLSPDDFRITGHHSGEHFPQSFFPLLHWCTPGYFCKHICILFADYHLEFWNGGNELLNLPKGSKSAKPFKVLQNNDKFRFMVWVRVFVRCRSVQLLCMWLCGVGLNGKGLVDGEYFEQKWQLCVELFCHLFPKSPLVAFEPVREQLSRELMRVGHYRRSLHMCPHPKLRHEGKEFLDKSRAYTYMYNIISIM